MLYLKDIKYFVQTFGKDKSKELSSGDRGRSLVIHEGLRVEPLLLHIDVASGLDASLVKRFRHEPLGGDPEEDPGEMYELLTNYEATCISTQTLSVWIEGIYEHQCSNLHSHSQFNFGPNFDWDILKCVFV